MPTTRIFRLVGTFLPLLVLLVAVGEDRADVVILKDGTTLFGTVKREGQKVLENGVFIPVGNGFFVLDDDVRRIVFSFRQVQDVDEKEVIKVKELVVLRQKFTPFTTAQRVEPFGPILEVTNFDGNWDRTFKYQPTKGGPFLTKQKMTHLNPYFAAVESQRHLWQAMYLTRELGPDAVVGLLHSHPDLKEKAGAVDPEKRMKVFRFLLQAGWHNAAEQELNRLLTDAPAEKDRVETARGILQQQRCQELLDDLEAGHKAGRHAWTQKQLANFPEGADERQQAKVRALQTKYEAAEEALTTARRFLKELPPLVSPEAHKPIFAEAAAAILNELNIDNYERLETFGKLAKQAERDKKEAKPTIPSPGDLLALAVSSWLLGNGSAEAKAETGLRLWKARKLVQDIQKTHSAPGREKLLERYEQDKTDLVPFDELAQLIRFLPPIEPESKLSTDLMPLETKPVQGRGKAHNYIVQLPAEYHHSRTYPVLIVLHQSIEKPTDALERWIKLAGQHGYILVAPEWTANAAQLRPQYTYSAEEHAAVLESLQDLKRRFNVDTDRVFLTGLGQGGDMAFDVGLSHPDQFAGVVPMGAQPRYHAKSYAVNGQFLPFYVVCGELAGDAPKAIREQFKTWVSRGTPALYVEYKGRGHEPFTGELPYIFEWMNRKKRASATPELSECLAMRPTDNRFYWLTGDSLNPRSINDIAKWNSLTAPGTLQGKLTEGNQISVYVKNYKKVTIWLGPGGVIDLTKPVSISLNTGLRVKEKMLTPSLATLLEDFYQRGDRQRLFVVKVELGL
jgi:pimeloyl-ACP methyl ester carboxylesterase